MEDPHIMSNKSKMDFDQTWNNILLTSPDNKLY